MPIDSSIPLQAKPPVMQNPLMMFGQAAQLQNAVNANKLFQAQQAAGQAFQSAIDPTTGKLDVPTFQRNLAANPLAAAAAGGELTRSQALANAQQGFNEAQKAQLASGIGALLVDPTGELQNRQSYENMVGMLRNQGVVNDQQAQAALSRMPPDGAPPAAFRRFGLTLLTGSMAGPQVMQQAFGNQTAVNNGQFQQGGVQASPVMGGGITLNGPAVPVNLPTRSELLNQQPGFDPVTKQPTATPLGVRAQEQGMGGLLGPAGQAVPNPRQGRYPTTSAQTGPALGQQAAADVTSAESAKQGVSLTQTADAVPTRKAALDNMLSDLQSLNTGPGADWEKTANALSNRLTGLGITMSPKQVADQENFNKIAKQIALAQTQTLGVGTDQKLETTLGANPNSELSKMGNQQVIGMLKGNEDAIALKNLAWQQWQQTHGSQSYGTFSTQFNRSFDPRALQAVYMDPADKAKLAATLNKDPLAKARFISTLKQGIAAGIIQAPSNGQ